MIKDRRSLLMGLAIVWLSVVGCDREAPALFDEPLVGLQEARPNTGLASKFDVSWNQRLAKSLPANEALHDAGNVLLNVSSGAFGNHVLTGPGHFKFPKSSAQTMLFYGSLFIGDGPYRTLENLLSEYGDPNSTQDFDVIPGGEIRALEPGAVSDEDIFTVLSDVGAANPIGLIIIQESFAFASPPDDDYIIIRFTFVNPSENDITNFFAGVWLDWDLTLPPGLPLFSSNTTAYDVGRQLAFVTSADPSFPVAGSIILGASVNSYRGSVNLGLIFDCGTLPTLLCDPRTTAEQFAFLSGGILPGPVGPSDVRQTLSQGPLSIPAGGCLSVNFALLGGVNQADLEFNVDAARANFSQVRTQLSLLGLREIRLVLGDMILSRGTEQALNAVLRAIERSVLRGNKKAALGQVGAFGRVVAAHEDRSFSAEQLVLLKALACNLRNQIEES